MTSGWEPRRDSQDAGALLRENAALRAENLALREVCHANARARQQAAQDKAQLDEILGSRAWAVVQGARRVAAIVGRRGILRADGSARPASPHVLANVIGERARPDPRHAPKVSVIVPNYNHAPYLEERLRSIFAQTYPPHEILFLDDASSDVSLEVARRLAPESPVPFRLVLNGSNSGSTFRQWLKGIDLARGDLIWIAESDDTCRPDLLECLVPQFDDPEVMLAYCQSAMIGPDGQQYTADYLAATEDISPVHWRYPYIVPGRDEVELALSQRNTIPNASAVIFRKPAGLEEREDLERLKLGGDWLFYAMRIRRGKIAYVPEPLNGHRHHDRSVRSSFETAIELFEEQLQVKARIFESFPVTATAISGSLARGFAEYADRMQGADPRPAMTEHPRLVAHLDRIRSAFRARMGTRQGTRILVVLSGVTDHPEHRAAIRRANALARRFPVFLCNATPGDLDPVAAVRVDERIVLLEGTLGLLPWAGDGDPRPDGNDRGEAASSRRAKVIRELIRFHRIDAIHAQGRPAEELIAAAGPDPAIRRPAHFGEIAGDDPDRRPGNPEPAPPRPGPVPVREARSIVLASRVHRLVLTLRDTRKHLAEVERALAEYVERSAAPAWQLGAAIDRVSRRVAPRGSRRRRALGSLIRSFRRAKGQGGDVAETAGSEARAGAARDVRIPETTAFSPANGGRVLIVDYDVPTPDLDSGSVRMMGIIKAILGRGHGVTLIPALVSAPPRYLDDLEALGVEVVPPGYDVAAAYLEGCGPSFDLAILSRQGVASRYLDLVKRLAPRARTVFDTVDLHFLRELRAARTLADREMVWEARRRKLEELSLVRRCDATLVVSPVEREILARWCPGRDIRLLPNIIEVPDDEPPGREGRRDMIFIGGFRHAPNVDAVVHFVEDILPLILRRSPDMVFQIVGSHPPERFAALESENVRLVGYVPDLTPILRRTLISVAPLRYGAGVKGKVNLSMAHGVPTVVSPVAAEGMHLIHGQDALIADDPAGFADAVLALADSPELWRRLATNGRANVRAHFSVDVVRRQIDDLLALAGPAR